MLLSSLIFVFPILRETNYIAFTWGVGTVVVFIVFLILYRWKYPKITSLRLLTMLS
jgi:predicted membrane channel-forming protein YqfA (hemolysin III family)